MMAAVLQFPEHPDADLARRLKESFARSTPPVVGTDEEWLSAAQFIRESAAERRRETEGMSPDEIREDAIRGLWDSCGEGRRDMSFEFFRARMLRLGQPVNGEA